MNQHLLIPGETDLITKCPEARKLWDYEKNNGRTPSEVSACSNQKFWWRCEMGHGWEAVAYSISNGKRCPYCANRKILAGFNDLDTKNPNLAAEWDYEKNTPLTPKSVTEKSHKEVWWKGICGHSWKAKISNRSNGTGCPYCSGKKVLKGFNDLADRYPELTSEWDYEKNDYGPEDVTYGSKKKIWWVCKNHHRWQACISDRIRGNGCPYCAHRRPVAGENDLATVYPELIKEWDPTRNTVRPDEVTYQSRKKVWWICEEGHSWRTEIYHRTKKKTGCPICSHKQSRHLTVVGKNDLATCRPEIAKEWDYERNIDLTPDQVMPFSTRRVWWKCENGHHWQSSVQTRQKGTGCPICKGRIFRKSRLI